MLSQTMAVDSNTIGCLGQTCSYWERAAKQLEDKEPSVFAALQELRKESSRTSKDMPSEISQIIEHHRNTMENKQWSLPFKVRGTEVKIRAQLDNVWNYIKTFKRCRIYTCQLGSSPCWHSMGWCQLHRTRSS